MNSPFFMSILITQWRKSCSSGARLITGSGVAGGAEVPPLAGVGREKVLVCSQSRQQTRAKPCRRSPQVRYLKTVSRITSRKKPYRSSVALRVDLLEQLVVLLDDAAERRITGTTRAVNPLLALGHADGRMQDGCRSVKLLYCEVHL